MGRVFYVEETSLVSLIGLLPPLHLWEETTGLELGACIPVKPSEESHGPNHLVPAVP